MQSQSNDCCGCPLCILLARASLPITRIDAIAAFTGGYRIGEDRSELYIIEAGVTTSLVASAIRASMGSSAQHMVLLGGLDHLCRGDGNPDLC